jgi:hypothetical protein
VISSISRKRLRTLVPDGTKAVAKAATKKSLAVQSKGAAVQVANLASNTAESPDDVIPVIPLIPEKPSVSVPVLVKETVSPISAKLDIEEAFAESLTNAFIRKVTVPIRNKLSAQQRSVNYKVKKENIGITYNAQISATSNKILNEVCEVEFPEQEKWRTENGVWKGGDITQRDVWRAIYCLRNAGYEITAITVGAV